MTQRRVSVYDNLEGISVEWVGVKCLIKVERTGTRLGKPYHQVAYYISSLSATAAEIAVGIRQHWGIENGLHWVKDVVLQEDNSQIKDGVAAANLSVTRSIAMNILRQNGYGSLTVARRLIGNDLQQIFLLLQ